VRSYYCFSSVDSFPSRAFALRARSLAGSRWHFDGSTLPAGMVHIQAGLSLRGLLHLFRCCYCVLHFGGTDGSLNNGNFLSGVIECHETHCVRVSADGKNLDEDVPGTEKIWQRLAMSKRGG